MAIKHVRIVGSGLIGTSIGLGLRAKGLSLEMIDSQPAAQRLAQDLVGPHSGQVADLVIFALPTGALSQVLDHEFSLNPASKFIDIGSTKTKPSLEVSTSVLPSQRFCPTHPMAGREVGGAESARGDLFMGRPWILSTDGVDPDVVEAALEVITLLGAVPHQIGVKEHDAAVSLISHLPQILSSALAAQLPLVDERWMELAGAGLRDTTRIAASDPNLWSEIINFNAAEVSPVLERLIGELQKVHAHLTDANTLHDFFVAGNLGVSKIPGKHGGQARNFTKLPIVIEDKPGQLGELFNECGKANVNVEDLSIEHTPGQFTGLITLSLSSSDADILFKHLTASGWNVHSPR